MAMEILKLDFMFISWNENENRKNENENRKHEKWTSRSA